jgi:hypothetical protein
MNSAHIAALYFEDKREAAKKRIQKLKSAGLVTERPRRVSEPSILFLTSKALKLLRDEGILAKYPELTLSSLQKRTLVSDLTLRHELEVMDVKAAFHSAARKTETFGIAEFSTWPLLHQFEAFPDGYSRTEVLVKPDGFIRIHEKEADGGTSEHTFFLELDRSTEVQDTLVSRAACYLNYYSAGGFAERNGAPRSAFKDFPFRVLFVLQNDERRNNTAERLLQGSRPIFTQVCLTTLDEATANPLGPIWITPAAYRDATTGTLFDPMRPRNGFGYRRQSDREQLVEGSIRKQAILA